MNERLKLLRKKLGLTQSNFAECTGVSQSAIANYEAGSRLPNESVIMLICNTFNVNEKWLREGKGEIFKETPLDIEEITANTPASPREIKLVKRFFNLSHKERELFLSMLDYLLKDEEKAPLPQDFLDRNIYNLYNISDLDNSNKATLCAEDQADYNDSDKKTN